MVKASPCPVINNLKPHPIGWIGFSVFGFRYLQWLFCHCEWRK